MSDAPTLTMWRAICVTAFVSCARVHPRGLISSTVFVIMIELRRVGLYCVLSFLGWSLGSKASRALKVFSVDAFRYLAANLILAVFEECASRLET